jgi:hypothetical protein
MVIGRSARKAKAETRRHPKRNDPKQLNKPTLPAISCLGSATSPDQTFWLASKPSGMLFAFGSRHQEVGPALRTAASGGNVQGRFAAKNAPAGQAGNQDDPD